MSFFILRYHRNFYLKNDRQSIDSLITSQSLVCQTIVRFRLILDQFANQLADAFSNFKM